MRLTNASQVNTRADEPSALQRCAQVGVLVATVVNASFGGLLISVMLRLFSSITKARRAAGRTHFVHYPLAPCVYGL